MTQLRPSRWNIILLAVCAILSLGLSDIKLIDIETAVIEKDYQAAKKLAKDFVAGHPQKSQMREAQYYLGLSELFLGDHEQARQTFQRLLDSYPSAKLSDKTQIGVIDSYILEGRYYEALSKAKGLLRTSKKSEFKSLIYLKVARIHLKLAEWRQAKQYLNKIVNEFPESVESHRARQLLEEEQFFSVQVGSFLERNRAVKITDELQRQDEYAYIVETTDESGKKYYRVRIGKFSRLDQAQNMKRKLSRLGYPTQIYP